MYLCILPKEIKGSKLCGTLNKPLYPLGQEMVFFTSGLFIDCTRRFREPLYCNNKRNRKPWGALEWDVERNPQPRNSFEKLFDNVHVTTPPRVSTSHTRDSVREDFPPPWFWSS